MTNPQVSPEIMARYREVAVATVYGGIRQTGFDACAMRGVRNFTPGERIVGRARTLRFMPPRPDLAEETDRGEDAPEYRAMGSCGLGDVLVCDAMGRRYGAIGGDVKLLQLKMVGAEGLVTDGGIRDLEVVRSYGLKVFAGERTVTGGAPEIVPYDDNLVVRCGGVTVRPGDIIVGDDDGVVVVPARHAAEVVQWAEEHERLEERMKELIQRENVAPGRYYNAEGFERLKNDARP